MSRLWSAVLFALVVQTIPATTINGSVVDGHLAPVAGAVVTLNDIGREVARAVTDQAGRFIFPLVKPGVYNVRATHDGFPAFSRSLTINGSSATMELPIVMLRPEDVRADTLRANQNGASVRAAVMPPPQALPIASPPAGPPPAGAAVVTAGGGGGRGGGGGQNLWAQPYFDSRINDANTETYGPIRPTQFELTAERRLSTFGADVDTASYTNMRRMLSSGQLPPHDAVRIEEMVNYFRFDYASPRDGKPVAITTEVGPCPWEPSHRLVLIGARAATPPKRAYDGRNIVLLIDVSGSMAPPERLPLIKTALEMFVDTLTQKDTIAIVTYAGTSGVALPPTNGSERRAIHAAIAELGAGGSTNGAQGLIAAYRIAREAFIPNGINRVILATDGDFNVGITSQTDLHHLIERERDSGVFLSVLGVGSGNLKDQTMEMLADKGNGNYSYIDSLQEARRVLISEGESTLTTVAKDVKFQVEFNPEFVAEWRLIGYENRKMAARDFENDRKDAGDMDAGHTVTVLYELIPSRSADKPAGDWFTVNTRYKLPDEDESQLLVHRARPNPRAEFLPFASAVAEFGLLLRDHPRDSERWDALARRLRTMGAPEGLADEKRGFEEMVELARSIARLR